MSKIRIGSDPYTHFEQEHNKDYRIKVNTNIYKNRIEVDTCSSMYPDKIARQVIDLQNEAVREGLIKLGWTPPTREEADRIARAQEGLLDGQNKA